MISELEKKLVSSFGPNPGPAHAFFELSGDFLLIQFILLFYTFN